MRLRIYQMNPFSFFAGIVMAGEKYLQTYRVCKVLAESELLT